jgi:hypothetical protein
VPGVDEQRDEEAGDLAVAPDDGDSTHASTLRTGR